MRFFTIPQPFDLPNKAYGLKEFAEEVIAGHPSWRASADKLALLDSILDKLDASGFVPGFVVELTDAEHEAGTPVVTVAGTQLAPHAARAVNRIARAWLSAPTKDPRPPKIEVPTAAQEQAS